MVKTYLHSVIGCYCPGKWENTTGKISTIDLVDYKDIVEGKPFLFYFLDGKIEIIKHRFDVVPSMISTNY